MLSDDKRVATAVLRWCDDLPYDFDKAFALNLKGSWNIIPKVWSFFEPLIDCRFAFRFVSLFSVPIWEPEFLGEISNETLLVISITISKCHIKEACTYRTHCGSDHPALQPWSNQAPDLNRPRIFWKGRRF